MKRLILILFSGLIAASAHATFELEDPAEPGKENIEPREKPLFGKWGGKGDVIIGAGTMMYVPKINNKKCVGWQQAGTHSSANESAQDGGRTSTTYIGKIVSKVDCHNGGQSKSFSIVETTQGKVLWVESSQVLSAD